MSRVTTSSWVKHHSTPDERADMEVAARERGVTGNVSWDSGGWYDARLIGEGLVIQGVGRTPVAAFDSAIRRWDARDGSVEIASYLSGGVA